MYKGDPIDSVHRPAGRRRSHSMGSSPVLVPTSPEEDEEEDFHASFREFQSSQFEQWFIPQTKWKVR